MRPYDQFDFPPGKINIMAMTLIFSKLADFIGKVKGLSEIFKLTFFFNIVLINHLPGIINFL
jgi:hypothetical protein